VISAINSLTLSPALAARLLRPHGAPRDLPTRVIDVLFGWLFRGFNRVFHRTARTYSGAVGGTVRHRRGAFVVYAIAIGLAVVAFRSVPGGFVPTQDKMYLIGIAHLPEGASLDRTEAVVREMTKRALATKGVAHAIAFPGLNAVHFTNTPNAATVFITLDGAETREHTAPQIAGELSGKFAGIKDAFAFAIMPPPILGIGPGAGFSLYVQDRGARGDGELAAAVNALSGALAKQPGFLPAFSSYQPNVPQLDLSIDRTKAKMQGVSLSDLFETLQIYLGSAYVNDFNRFGRTYQVIAQADGSFRDHIEQIAEMKTRNTAGQLVPIGSVVDVGHTYGPDPVVRYNGFPAADLVGQVDPAKLSSAEAIAAVDQLAPDVLPPGLALSWTDLSFQQVSEGHANLVVFPIALLLVFLVLAALYESWILPLAILLIVPLCLLAALTGVWLTGGDRNVFVQIGLVVLMGLATKNAILIVEFARELEQQGRTIIEAAVEASRLRLRPIVMTSLAFIAGVVPLMLSTGAGAEIRRAMGVTVFAGMIGVTLSGLVLTPVFYVALRTFVTRRVQLPITLRDPPVT
jgi:multidrug efflux pump